MDQDSNLVETYEGQNVALMLLWTFHLWFGSVSRFLSKLGYILPTLVKVSGR